MRACRSCQSSGAGERSREAASTRPGTVIGSIDITQTSLKESINGAQFTNTDLGEALKSAVAVRIIEGF